MRTTLTIDDDLAVQLERLRRDRVGLPWESLLAFYGSPLIHEFSIAR